MYERLLKSIADKLAITQEEPELCTSYFTLKKLRKRQYLLQEGDICSRLAFVEAGALYSYSIDNKSAP
jgi:CRP-like cAMP-binding protein